MASAKERRQECGKDGREGGEPYPTALQSADRVGIMPDGVEAGLRYSDPAAIKERLEGIVEDFRVALPRFGEHATIPFNRKAEWGSDGRIVPSAPVYSPFIRRKQQLELE